MKYSLLDTNTMIALLRQDDFGLSVAERASREEWVFVLYTAVDAELGQLEGGKANEQALREFYERFLSSNRFGVAKSIAEIRSDEIRSSGSTASIQPCEMRYEGFVQTTKAELSSLLDKTNQLSNQAQASVTEMSDPPKIERIRKHLAGFSGRKLLDLAESTTGSILPSRTIPFLGLCYKLEGNRKVVKNDFFDLSFFYLLPYIHVFVTENNNAEIIKKIKSLGLLSDLEVIRVSQKT